MSALWGIWGRPYLDLSSFIDTSCFADLHDEITSALPLVSPEYTGGTLKWMGVTAPWHANDGYVDAMHAIDRMTTGELAAFAALADDPSNVRAGEPFGDETD